jgi:hypothetical protein
MSEPTHTASPTSLLVHDSSHLVTVSLPQAVTDVILEAVAAVGSVSKR